MSELRVLTKSNELELRAFLMRDPLYNLFMIGDLDVMGLDTEDLTFWGQLSPDGKLIGVAMRYHVWWCFYSNTECDPRPFAQLIDDFADSQGINGHPDQVDPIIAKLERYGVRELHASYYCRLPLNAALPTPAWSTRRATVADADALGKLYATAGHMQRDADDVRRQLQEQGRRIAVTEDAGRIVSAAATSIETSHAAMIGGVFTPESLRNRGYASAAMTHLCTRLLAEGIQPCLFYDNPAAGSIYRRLGFEDIGPWHLVFLQPIQVSID
jgi:predicted GNAT family acetyltransferase